MIILEGLPTFKSWQFAEAIKKEATRAAVKHLGAEIALGDLETLRSAIQERITEYSRQNGFEPQGLAIELSADEKGINIDLSGRLIPQSGDSQG